MIHQLFKFSSKNEDEVVFSKCCHLRSKELKENFEENIKILVSRLLSRHLIAGGQFQQTIAVVII